MLPGSPQVRTNSILLTRIVPLDQVGLLQVVLRDDPTFSSAMNLEDCLARQSNESFCLGSALNYLACVGEGRVGSRYLVWKIHHAVWDVWQNIIILQKLTLAYQGERLPKEIGFNSFVHYVLDKNKDASSFWPERLTGAPPATFPVKPLASYSPSGSASRKHLVRLPQGLNITDITLNTSIRLAWALILGAYMQSSDVIFGVTVTGRNAPVPGIENMAGPTIATVPIRVRLNYQSAVHCALHEIREQAIAMLPYEQTGLQHIRSLSSELTEICDFQTLVVVHQQVTFNEMAILKICEEQSDYRFPYGSFGLVLKCTLSSDRK